MRAALLVLVGCSGVTADPGLTSKLQIANAQFRPGEFPSDDGGPAALALAPKHSLVVIDHFNEPVRGTLAANARAAAIGIVGSDDAWVVTASTPDVDSPGLPTARAIFGLAPDFTPGPFEMRMAASDEHGRFGAPATAMVVALDEEPVAGELVVGLYWEGAADLNLHVVDPLGGEAWSDDPNTFVPPPPPTLPDPAEYLKHGIFNSDGNKNCVRDGRPREHVVWQMPPPSGEYIVRVDARAMCGAPIASWYAVAYRNGELVAQVRGLATPDDVIREIDPERGRAGAGVLAFRFTVP